MPVTIKTLLAEAEANLSEQGIATPRLEAEALLARILATNRVHLFSHLSSPVSPLHQAAFQHALERRVRREPLAYITGAREFWSLDFAVTPAVLIPRPETELVVETALKLITQKRAPSPLEREGQEEGNIQKMARHPLLHPLPSRERKAEDCASRLTILDVGTGSGCIAIALATELPGVEFWAVDVSHSALTVAQGNAQRHNVAQRIHFLQGDLFSPLKKDEQRFDFIVANPPYIVRSDLATLQPEVREWEPRTALDGGEDGLDFYRRLVKESPTYLHPGGCLLMELGAGQSPGVLRLIQSQSNFQDSWCVRDYAGIERVVVAHSCV